MKLKYIMLVTAIALFSFGVSAAEYQTTAQKKFNELDTNHDGYISQEEAKADSQLSQDWNAADTNKDGKLEESEFSAFEENQEMGGKPMEPAK